MLMPAFVSCNGAEGIIAHIGVGVGEIGVIEEIESLETELWNLRSVK